jgi:hypothetical protein
MGAEIAAGPMLRRFTDLRVYTIGATDGDIGTVEDAYFDDRSWTVRYLVVDAGSWLSGRKVLISPSSISGVDPAGKRLETVLTRGRSPKVRPSIRRNRYRVSTRPPSPRTMGTSRTGPVRIAGERTRTRTFSCRPVSSRP